MSKLTIRKVERLAQEFARNNPDVNIPISDVRLMIALGVAPDRVTDAPQRDPDSAPIDKYEAAIAEFRRPFTAGELAEKVHGAEYVSRITTRDAGTAARRITGKEPRRSNGREVYDPIIGPHRT